MKLVRLAFVMMLAVLVVAAVAACGDDDEDGGDNGGEPAATTPSVTDDEAGGGEEVTVEAVDLGFDPEDVTVPADLEVVVKLNNTGAASHTLDVYADEGFTEPIDGASTGNVSGGEEGEFTATFATGEYFFRCEIHPGQMQGTLTAE